MIGRLAPGVTPEQADAELRVFGERTSAALPATHAHLRPRVMRLGEESGLSGLAELAATNLPGLAVMFLACLNVGTLIYARTATREGEIVLRSALGASRGRIIGQLFVEALVLASVAAALGLFAANWLVTFFVSVLNQSSGGMPFWVTRGLRLSTILYAGGLAIVSAAMLSLAPALKATRARMQAHLANLGTGGATLRFGRVWTAAMIAQVTFTAMAIPAAVDNAHQAIFKAGIRAEFPSREYLSARLDLDRPSRDEAAPAFEERQARSYADLARRIAKESGVIAVTYADSAPDALPRGRIAHVEPSPATATATSAATGAAVAYDSHVRTSAVGPGFFEVFDRTVVAGRAFHEGDWKSTARTVIVNEAFARGFQRKGGRGTPIGARLRYAAAAARSGETPAEPWFEIVGIVRDFGLTPDDEGNEPPYVFHAASPGMVSALVMCVRVRGNPAPLAARLPAIAADLDAGWFVRESRPLDESIRQRDALLFNQAALLAGVTALVLLLSAMGIFSLMSVSVSRRTREIGLRAALGASPRHVLAQILSRTLLLMGSGIATGSVVVLIIVWLKNESLMLFAGWIAMTSAVMLAACLLACLGPARRALALNPIDALRDA